MGRNNNKYRKSLVEQAYAKLVGMQAFGSSKKAAMEDGTAEDKIFSFSTYETYYKHTKYFCDYIQKEHPECTTLKAARKYANEWLDMRANSVNSKGEPLSAWTIQTEAKALGKLYGIKPDDEDYFHAPKRSREDITRSRGDAVRDKHFSEKNNAELIKFCRGTGLRRSELESLKRINLLTKEQIEAMIHELKATPTLSLSDSKKLNALLDARFFPDANYFLFVKGKGGRFRPAPIVGKDIDKIVERIMNTPDGKKVWEYVNSNADVHGYRAEYATYIYKKYARDINDIPFDKVNKGTGRKYQGDVYVCRKDEVGKKLDKKAMEITSKALGHNRISVMADHYLRGL